MRAETVKGPVPMPVRALLQGRNRGYFTYLPLQMFLQQALTGNQQQSRQISASISGVALASMARMRS